MYTPAPESKGIVIEGGRFVRRSRITPDNLKGPGPGVSGGFR